MHLPSKEPTVQAATLFAFSQWSPPEQESLKKSKQNSTGKLSASATPKDLTAS